MTVFPLSLVARVQDGTTALSRGQRERLARYLKAREGRFVQITVREQGRPRSLNQNAYYHGVVVQMIADETGHEPEEVHAILKWKFLPRQFVTFGGDQVEVTKSTTDLSTTEFEDYLERIRAFAATDLNMRIPLPRET